MSEEEMVEALKPAKPQAVVSVKEPTPQNMFEEIKGAIRGIPVYACRVCAGMVIEHKNFLSASRYGHIEWHRLNADLLFQNFQERLVRGDIHLYSDV